MEHFGASVITTDQEKELRDRKLVRVTVSLLVRDTDVTEAIDRLTVGI